jgi:hypothetical protein
VMSALNRLDFDRRLALLLRRDTQLAPRPTDAWLRPDRVPLRSSSNSSSMASLKKLAAICPTCPAPA